MEPAEEPRSCCFDDWSAANAKRARSRETVAGVSAPLVAALHEEGIEGRTVLDVGCGVGDVLLTLLARGARSGTGMDLGSGGIREARALAASRGLAERATFLVGDGAAGPLPDADVVVLNRVLCCFPDADRLVDNAAAAARQVVALTAPVDRGAAGAFNRVSTWWSNRWYAIRRGTYRGFRVFVHDLDAVERRLAAAGFERTQTRRVRGVWRLDVFARSARERGAG